MDAGFAPGSDARIAKSSRAEETISKREYNRLTKAPRTVHPDLERPVPEQILHATLAQIEIQLRIGNLEAARLKIDEFADAIGPMPPPASYDDFLALSLADLGLSMRTLTMLDVAGMETLGDLLAGFPQRLIGVRNCGLETVREIGWTLVEWGAMTTEQRDAAVEEWQPKKRRDRC